MSFLIRDLFIIHVISLFSSLSHNTNDTRSPPFFLYSSIFFHLFFLLRYQPHVCTFFRRDKLVFYHYSKHDHHFCLEHLQCYNFRSWLHQCSSLWIMISLPTGPEDLLSWRKICLDTMVATILNP